MNIIWKNLKMNYLVKLVFHEKLEFCQNTFDIDPHGILIWSKLNTAIVSDLHLEKGSSYAKYGQYIPPYDSLETLIKLEKILSFSLSTILPF